MTIRSLRALLFTLAQGYLAAQAGVLTQGCASSASSKPAKTNENVSSLIDEKTDSEDRAIIEGHRCLGDNDKPRQCESDEDCCQGFYCGRDPQVSEVIKVCMSSTP